MSENEALSRIGEIRSLISQLVETVGRWERKALADQINMEIESLIGELANDYERFRHQIENLKSQVDELREE